jgi:hypothetical protein
MSLSVQPSPLDGFRPGGDGPRPVPGPLAPAELVTVEQCVAGCGGVVLVGRDLEGNVRVRIDLAREDASSWWFKVIRLWLAWRYKAVRIRLVGSS